MMNFLGIVKKYLYICNINSLIYKVMENKIIEKIEKFCKEERPISEEANSEFEALYNEIKSFFRNCPEKEVSGGVTKTCSFQYKIFGEKFTVNIEKFKTDSVDTYGYGHDGHVPIFCSLSNADHELNYSETVEPWREDDEISKKWLNITIWSLKKDFKERRFMFPIKGDYYYRSVIYSKDGEDLFLKKFADGIYHCHKCVLEEALEDFKVEIENFDRLTEERFMGTDMYVMLSHMEDLCFYLYNERKPYERPSVEPNPFKKVLTVSMLYDELNECFEWLLREVAIILEKKHCVCNGNGMPFNFEVSNNLVDASVLF